MRKLLALLLAVSVLFSLSGCAGFAESAPSLREVALIADNEILFEHEQEQLIWEGMSRLAEEHEIKIQYYKSESDETAGCVAAMEEVIADGYRLLVLPGAAFAAAIGELAPKYPDVKFIGLNISQKDLSEAGVSLNHDELRNVYCAAYDETVMGFLTGYAAVKLGHRRFFLPSGLFIPKINDYGSGFMQGADAAARELKITVELDYPYGIREESNADATSVMEQWLSEGAASSAIVSCSSKLHCSAAEAATAKGGSLILPATDEQTNIAGLYGEDLISLAADTDMAATVQWMLTEVMVKGNWEEFAGKTEALGLVSWKDLSQNHIGLNASEEYPGEKFTEQDYRKLVKGILKGKWEILRGIDDVTELPDSEYTDVSDIIYDLFY